MTTAGATRRFTCHCLQQKIYYLTKLWS